MLSNDNKGAKVNGINVKPGDRVLVRPELAEEVGHDPRGVVVGGDDVSTEEGRPAVWVRPDDSPENESFAYDAELGVELTREDN